MKLHTITCRERPSVAATLTYAWVKIFFINSNDVLENTGMFRFAAIEILSPHAGTPYMESCRKLVSPAKH